MSLIKSEGWGSETRTFWVCLPLQNLGLAVNLCLLAWIVNAFGVIFPGQTVYTIFRLRHTRCGKHSCSCLMEKRPWCKLIHHRGYLLSQVKWSTQSASQTLLSKSRLLMLGMYWGSVWKLFCNRWLEMAKERASVGPICWRALIMNSLYPQYELNN